MFAELVEAGFDILTYRKGPLRPEPRSTFTTHQVTDTFGHPATYLLADRPVRIAYDKRRRYFACRQVTRLDPVTGHQTQIVATRRDLAPTEIAQATFSRWREENLFRFMRPRGLDGMDSYAKIPDDPARLVPNPAKTQARKDLTAARAGVADAKQAVLDGARQGDSVSTRPVDEAEAALAELKTTSKTIPAKVALGDIRPGAQRLDDERKRLHDAARMATWNAEHTLTRALAPHYARAEDEAHSLLAETFRSPGDLQIIGDELHVRLDPLSSPRRTRAIAALCVELTATETLYPGTNLRLVYTTKNH